MGEQYGQALVRLQGDVYKRQAYYPSDAGVAIAAPLEKASMDSIVSFTEEHCEVEDSVIYYLYACLLYTSLQHKEKKLQKRNW